MPDLRLIASDIDGTLADDQGELAPETIVTLRALLRRGMSVVLVTGLNLSLIHISEPTRPY